MVVLNLVIFHQILLIFTLTLGLKEWSRINRDSWCATSTTQPAEDHYKQGCK